MVFVNQMKIVKECFFFQLLCICTKIQMVIWLINVFFFKFFGCSFFWEGGGHRECETGRRPIARRTVVKTFFSLYNIILQQKFFIVKVFFKYLKFT